MHATDIVAYTYAADIYHPDCVIEELIAHDEASPGARGMDVEEALDQIASANGIDRMDEYSFDSDDFPKVVFASQVEQYEESCGWCQMYILD